MFKTFEHCRFSLDPCIGDVTDLVTIESSPVLAVVSSVERQDIAVIDKVDKCVTPIASVLKINREVEEINDSRPVAVLRELG